MVTKTEGLYSSEASSGERGPLLDQSLPYVTCSLCLFRGK